MIEGEFQDAIGAEPVGFSHRDFGLVVQPLHDTAGEHLLSAEVVQDEVAVIAEGAGDLLHGFDAGPHSLTTPLIEELAGPGRRDVFPELLKSFLEKVCPDGFEVVAKQIAQAEVLFGAEILAAPQQQPSGFLENRRDLPVSYGRSLRLEPDREPCSYWRRCESG